MEDYAGRVLADRYRLPLPPSDEYELVETRAFDTNTGQEVLVRQVPLPEVVDAEVLDADGRSGGAAARQGPPEVVRGATRRSTEPAVMRAIEAAQAAARIPDHPRLDQVFDVFAEGGSLWIVSELVAARPLAALLAERPLSPYRAAEVASDVLTALRVLHAHGWTHRNITVRTVLVCEDGRVVLTGLAAGAAEEALCGYDPVPPAEPPVVPPVVPPNSPNKPPPAAAGPGAPVRAAAAAPAEHAEPGRGPRYRDRIDLAEVREPQTPPGAAPPTEVAADRAAADLRAARAGAIAAYRAGASQAAARIAEQRPPVSGGAPVERQPARGSNLPQGYSYPYGRAPEPGPAGPAPAGHPVASQLPGVEEQPPTPGGESEGAAPWHGATPRQGPPTPSAYGQLPVAAAAALPDRVEAGARPAVPSPGVPRAVSTPLAAERARQARIVVVGAVTERWAPEQAGPVHENWQLAAPVGPATDLWALGALLFRVVQGHAPYPEESAAELVQMVCGEPPAFAEECGPLRPVVESLLRQDPTERPDFEELRGWLRSLVRSAPEPEAGAHVVSAPPVDTARLPMVRRRGELVRRRRAAAARAAAEEAPNSVHGRHRQQRPPRSRARGQSRPAGRSSRSLGRTLLLGVLLVLSAVVAYALVFLPRTEGQPEAVGQQSPAPAASTPGRDRPTRTPSAPTEPKPQTGAPTEPVAEGFELHRDPEGFRIALPRGYDRRPKNDSGQVRFSGGEYELIVVPGRDPAGSTPDPLGYQRDHERELQPYRDSSWATQTGVRQIVVGQRVMAEGLYTWTDGTGRSVAVRNRVFVLGGRYHVVMVIGPEDGKGKVTEIFEQATGSYRNGA
ncbi:protein kinase [Streptomyces sp. NPDC006879]|uniref:protein kinase n=1 Tax=Streptomyces sp. NPDC006879 TaxID=3364767 RepID=UPI0036BECBA3